MSDASNFDKLHSALAEIHQLLVALSTIASIPDEDNEWDGRDKFRQARLIAQNAIRING